jgi:DNA repair protein RecN (Recombination protein N)
VGLNLVELRVRNLGVIEDVTIELQPGMTALTGETGAGKTLLVGAIGLLLGGRADSAMVRSGAEEALVEGRFLAQAKGEDNDADPDEILLARSVAVEGRSKAWIDGRMASIAALSEAAGTLIELHGQHQHRSLIHTEAQRGALDAFGRIDRTAMESARDTLRLLRQESTDLGGDARERAREADLLAYQLNEITSAGIEDVTEDTRLEVEEDRLAAASSYREAAGEALTVLSGEGEQDSSALDRLAEASGSLAGRAPLAPFEARLRAAMVDLSDLSIDLRSVVETWEDDPTRLEEIRLRRQLLHDLERKYGADLDEVVAFADRSRERLAEITVREERAAALDAEIADAHAVLELAEAEVASARRAAAPLMAERVEATLHELAMPSARFAIAVEGDGAADDITFLFGANTGETLLPLAKTASGGELARTMLAIRLAVTDTQGVMVFDEVDAGVGGTAATAVGAALAELGRHAQVLVVTHLPQVAALGDQQLGVRKAEHGGRTRTEVTPLDTDGRIVELSRMLSGSPESESARAHARELLEEREASATPT